MKKLLSVGALSLLFGMTEINEQVPTMKIRIKIDGKAIKAALDDNK